MRRRVQPARDAGGWSLEDANKAAVGLEALAPRIAARCPDPPDTGRKAFHANPAIVARVINGRVEVMKRAFDQLLKDTVNSWYGGTRLVDASSPDEQLLDAKKGGRLHGARGLGNPNVIKAAATKTSRRQSRNTDCPRGPLIIFRTGTPSWARSRRRSSGRLRTTPSPAPTPPRTRRATASCSRATAAARRKRILFGGDYELTRDSRGRVTSRGKNGIAAYAVPGCPYWRVVMFSLSQARTGATSFGNRITASFAVQSSLQKPV